MSKRIIEIDERKSVYVQDDGQVVVNNDNAQITANETTSKIDGVYHIDEDSILKLLALQNDMSYLKVRSAWTANWHLFSVTKHDDFDAKIKEIKENLEMGNTELENYRKANSNLNTRISNLERQIEKFNNTRHWWERKLKIKEYYE